MPFGTITSTESTFGSISGSIVGAVPGTLSGSVGVPGPQGIQGPVGPQGPQGVPGVGGAWGSIVGTLSAQGDLWTALSSKYDASNPNGFITSTALVPYITSATAASTYQPLSGMTAYLTTASAASTYAPIAAGLPTGGTVGQVLTKNSGTNYDDSWQTLIPGDRYVTTSTTSNSVSNGAKTFTVGTGLSYSSQQDVVISFDASNHMHAVVTSYNSGTGALVVDVRSHTGSGTYSSWTVNVGGTTPLQTVEWGEILGVLGDQSDLATALGNKLETSDAASTYQTIAGMSSYLTTADAATTYYLNTNPDGYITSSALTGYATESFVTSQGYITSAALSGYATESWVGSQGFVSTSGLGSLNSTVQFSGTDGRLVIDGVYDPGATGFSSARLNFGSSTPSQLLNGDFWTNGTNFFYFLGGSTSTIASTSFVTSQGYITSSALSPYLTSASAASTYAALAGATFTGLVSTPASATGSAGLRIVPGVNPTSPVNGDIWTTTNDLQVRLNGVTETVAEQSWVTAGFYPLSGNPSGFITSSALTPYAPLAGATFTGLVNTPASTTTTAGFRLPHGSAPTTPTDGDVWSTTGGLFWRQNAATKQAMNLGDTQTVSGNITFSNANVSLGTSTAAGTINVGTGATVSASTRTINIGTASAAGSTNNINIGGGSGTITTTVAGTLTATGTTLNLGNSTAASTINLGTGATLTATTKAVNIGTNGVAGSTTNIAIGSTTGTSTTTLQGTTNGVTAAADTNTTALATTAFVIGQAGSATPLVDGTAAVGTSLRYARQDHVHPTDTSRAALASPTFTGTPAAPTAAVDTNTTQIATTAYVVGQGYLKSATASSTYAPLASPALTGTPTAPTATAGTNTTQIATTAFVTAAVPAFGVTADINDPVSTTKAASIANVRDMMLNPGYQFFYYGAGSSSTALGGYYNSSGGRYKQYQSSTTSGSYGQFAFDTSGASLGYVGFTRGESVEVHNWSKKIWLSGRCLIGTWNSGGNGDANGVARINLGGKNGFQSGDLVATLKGMGWKVAGGGTAALVLTVTNGTTRTDVTSSFTPTLRQAFDWTLHSDGAGNVTLFVNNSQVATTSSGPTGNQTFGLYMEGVDAIGTVTTVFTLETFGTKIYHAT